MESKPRSRGRRVVDNFTVGLFAFVIGMPAYGLLFKKPHRLEENRERHPFPPVAADGETIEKFPARFELYLGDHIGYRDTLLSWHRGVMYDLLDESVTAKVWIGKDGWLFLYQTDPFQGVRHAPSVAARVDHWTRIFAERHAYLKARGIEYIVVIAPDKADVYPEHLRGYPLRHPSPECATPLAKNLEARGVPCLNLLPDVLAEKSRNPLPMYFKTDTHWTPAAAHAGYKQLAQAVTGRFPEFRMHPDTAYAPSRIESSGDLRRLVGVADDVPMETAEYKRPLTAVANRAGPDYFGEAQRAEHLNGVASVISTQPRASGPKILYLQDSFGDAFKPFLHSDFKRVANISTYGLPLEAVRIEQPQLVIQILVARQLYSYIPSNPPEVSKAMRE